MNYLTLPRIKAHCKIEEQFDLTDWELMSFADAAEEILAKTIDTPLVQLEDSEGHLPAALESAMLLIIGDLYNSRESDSTLPYKPTPAFERICALFHDYTLKHNG